jgi:hypothetical protein
MGQGLPRGAAKRRGREGGCFHRGLALPLFLCYDSQQLDPDLPGSMASRPENHIEPERLIKIRTLSVALSVSTGKVSKISLHRVP